MIQALLAPAQAQAWLPRVEGAVCPVSDKRLVDDHYVSRWMAEREPLVWVHLEREEELSGILDRETAVHDATLMLALCLDEDVSNSTRQEIAADLDEMLSDAAFEHDFSALWHSRLLPPDAATALSGLIGGCGSLKRLISWADQILRRQQIISDLCLAWDLIPRAAFQNNSRESVRDYCRQHGFFHAAVMALENDAVEPLLAGCLMQEGFPTSANRRVLFTSWFARFRRKHQRYEPQAEPGDWDDSQGEQTEVRIRINGLVAFNEVERRKAEIKRHLDRNERPQAETKTDWLCEYQLPRGGPSLCAKSLCDLAAHARKRDIIDVALTWSRKAIELASEDPFTRNEHAECLLKAGRLEEALKVYERTRMDHPHNAVVQNGYAECLRELGRLEEALKVYERTRTDHPNDAVVQNGYAECLRELGRLEEALKVYERTRTDHPNDAFAQSGYAECLRELGRLEEALKVYERTRTDHPNDAVVQNGYAECLRELGRLDEALKVYEQARTEHPHDAFVQNGYAECLRELGRLEEALKVYEQTRTEHPHNAVVQNGYAECLRELSRLEEALKVYEQTRTEHPHDAFAQSGYAECLRELGRLEEALKVYERTRTTHPQNRICRNALATLLCQLGRHTKALVLLPAFTPVSRQDWIDLHHRGVVLLRMGRWDEAEAIFASATSAKLNRVNRSYYKVSLAICRLKQQKFKEAMQQLELISMPSRLDGPFNLLRAHALAGDGQIEKSRVILDGMRTPRRMVAAVREELRHRFVENRPQHDEHWLLDKEAEMILCA